ncbi:MAG: methionine--tRNA ligase [bacterium]
MSKKNFYITTSIAYTNAVPHIGFALELIQADVIARYHRSLGENVWFLTGTDEHGIKIIKAAEKAGRNVIDFANDISSKYKELTKVLNISNDDFIRTTDQKRHWPTVEKIWKKLLNQEDIYKKKYKGLYCVGCEAFVKEKDLVIGNCSIHHQKPEEIEEENYFFKLSKYADIIKETIEKDKIKIIPQSRKNEILSFINQGVEDISCSRSKENLKWGIPVPGDEDQVVYVWFEALINYLSALESSGKEEFWPANIHCIGKDIFRFHVLLWPAMLLALEKELPKNVFVHGYITSSGEKMSKSLGNVIDPFELVKKYGLDPIRYFLLKEFSSTEDGDFTYEKFEERYNADLAKGLGNLISRVLKLLETVKVEKCSNLASNIEKTKENYEKSLSELKFNESLAVIWSLISDCDKYIENVKPWEDSENKKKEIASLVAAIEEIEVLLRPFLPETSEKILKQLKEKKAEALFPRI